MTPPLFGVVGWKNSGKTTLMVGLVGELSRRGFAVSVIKHAHAKFEIDHEGRDSYKMREAGACQVARPLMEMNAYPLAALYELVHDCGAARIGSFLTDHDGFLGAMLIFRKPGWARRAFAKTPRAAILLARHFHRHTLAP